MTDFHLYWLIFYVLYIVSLWLCLWMWLCYKCYWYCHCSQSGKVHDLFILFIHFILNIKTRHYPTFQAWCLSQKLCVLFITVKEKDIKSSPYVQISIYNSYLTILLCTTERCTVQHNKILPVDLWAAITSLDLDFQHMWTGSC